MTKTFVHSGTAPDGAPGDAHGPESPPSAIRNPELAEPEKAFAGSPVGPTGETSGSRSIHTSDSLRYQLDHGAGADKVSSSDPAAAPLGTDDEAAGHPPTAEQVQLAAAVELRSGPKVRRPTAVYPSSQSSGSFAIILAIGGLILIAAALFLYLT